MHTDKTLHCFETAILFLNFILDRCDRTKLFSGLIEYIFGDLLDLKSILKYMMVLMTDTS